MSGSEYEAEQLVTRLLEQRKAAPPDVSEKEAREAAYWLHRDLAVVPVGLGMITSSLRSIRRGVWTIALLLLILTIARFVNA